ncbi:hypothetical protein GJ700_32070 [Duganella sp. FT92W]|uniref:Uncharacterized protein n=1 Tax=Pseudoduganella rivuli TaxID=2666085 RepID=A0A7X2IV31_9BURK|nr:hypothetical protein [Pseudoduganella rivuli]MRV76357.1 hypothetical protein [Pseudoduganella rivuli]
MTFSSPPRLNPFAMLVMAVLHAALFSALLAQRFRAVPPQEGKLVEPIQWLLPLAPPASKKPVPDAGRAAPVAQPPRPAVPPATAGTRAEPISRETAAPSAPAATTAPSSPADPFDLANAPPAAATDALLHRRDWGAGKADHELRGGKLARLVRPTDTLQAGLERAFQDAGEAVPPKWFSAPEIRELSVPEGRMRMYKIRTAMGTYCFYKPDPSLEAKYDYKLMTCPREK